MLSTSQTTLALFFLKMHPAPVPVNSLVEHMYSGAVEPEWAVTCVQVQIHRTNKKLAAMNLEIYSTPVGYRLRQIVPMGGLLGEASHRRNEQSSVGEA